MRGRSIHSESRYQHGALRWGSDVYLSASMHHERSCEEYYRWEKEGKPESDILSPSISCIIERNKVEGYLFGVSHAYLTDERADVDEQVEELANN